VFGNQLDYVSHSHKFSQFIRNQLTLVAGYRHSNVGFYSAMCVIASIVHLHYRKRTTASFQFYQLAVSTPLYTQRSSAQE